MTPGNIMSMGTVPSGTAKSQLAIIPTEKGTVYAPQRYLRGVTFEENQKSGGALKSRGNR